MLSKEQVIAELELKVKQLKSDKEKVAYFVSSVAILKEIEDFQRGIKALKEGI